MKDTFVVVIIIIIIGLISIDPLTNYKYTQDCNVYMKKGMTLNDVKEKHGEGKFYNICQKIYEENTGTGKVEAIKVINKKNIINEKSGSGQDDITEGVIESVSGTGNINE